MCLTLLCIVANGAIDIALDPTPYKRPPSAYVAPTNCNADGIPSEDGLVCHPDKE